MWKSTKRIPTFPQRIVNLLLTVESRFIEDAETQKDAVRVAPQALRRGRLRGSSHHPNPLRLGVSASYVTGESEESPGLSWQLQQPATERKEMRLS